MESELSDDIVVLIQFVYSVNIQGLVIRFFGMIIIWRAFKMVVQPLQVVADCVPFIGNILGAANECVTFFLAFAVSTIVIAIAWFAYRPLLSLGLLVVVGVVGFFVNQRAKHNQHQGMPYDAKAIEIPTAEAFEIPTVDQFKDDLESQNNPEDAISSEREVIQ